MIQQGNMRYIPQLKKLWKECFEDEDTYIDAFFKALYSDEDVLLAEENGMLMGASFFLPGKIYLDGGWQDIRYVYALAVRKKFRGRGIARRLLYHAYVSYHAPLVAEPAEESLIDGFYEPAGFCQSFYLENLQMEMPKNDGADAKKLVGKNQFEVCAAGQIFLVEPVDAARYSQVRRSHFCKEGYVDWPLRHIDFALKEHRENHGEALLLTGTGRRDILLYCMEGRKVTVTETTLADETAAAFLSAWLPGQIDWLAVRGACESAGQAQLKIQDLGRQLAGMVYGGPPVNGYLNITLD